MANKLTFFESIFLNRTQAQKKLKVTPNVFFERESELDDDSSDFNLANKIDDITFNLAKDLSSEFDNINNNETEDDSMFFDKFDELDEADSLGMTQKIDSLEGILEFSNLDENQSFDAPLEIMEDVLDTFEDFTEDNSTSVDNFDELEEIDSLGMTQKFDSLEVLSELSNLDDVDTMDILIESKEDTLKDFEENDTITMNNLEESDALGMTQKIDSLEILSELTKLDNADTVQDSVETDKDILEAYKNHTPKNEILSFEDFESEIDDIEENLEKDFEEDNLEEIKSELENFDEIEIDNLNNFDDSELQDALRDFENSKIMDNEIEHINLDDELENFESEDLFFEKNELVDEIELDNNTDDIDEERISNFALLDTIEEVSDDDFEQLNDDSNDDNGTNIPLI